MKTERMDVESARDWAEAFVTNLLDGSYTIDADNDIDLKIVAVKRLIERNEELENALALADRARQAMARAIGAVL